MKLGYKLLFVLLCFCSLTACSQAPILKEEKPAVMHYDGFKNKDNVFLKADCKDLFKTMEEKKDGIFYFGFANCPWCVQILPTLNQVAKDKQIKISYIETRNSKNEMLLSDKELEKTINLLEDKLECDEEGKKHIYVPFVIQIKDGIVIKSHLGSVENHDAHERDMTKEEQIELEKIYIKLLS
ncbi:MAG: hypothetical protein RSC93_02390 [Erysipelotrichaceae bacterium]